MTNTKRKNPLEEARNHDQSRVRFQRRKQEEEEMESWLEEELNRLSDGEDVSIPTIR